MTDVDVPGTGGVENGQIHYGRSSEVFTGLPSHQSDESGEWK
jgi:hypothetical protein